MAREQDLETDLLAAFRWIEGHADVWRFFVDGRLLAHLVAALAEPFRSAAVTKVVGIESRGFILGGAVAQELGAGFVAIRKPGGIFPGEKLERSTDRDYRGRELKLRIQRDAVRVGDRVVLVDDWLETGSQARTARRLVEDCGGEFLGVSIIVDQLPDAHSRSEFGDFHALISAAALGSSSETPVPGSASAPETSLLPEIVEAVRAKQAPAGMPTKIIAIDGPGGAGKSTLAARLAKEFGGAQIVHTDDFASWDNPVNWWPRLIEEVLEPLIRSRSARYRRTDWGNPDHQEWGEVTPAEFAILEGVTASREAFQPFLTYAIWIDAPRDVRLRRGLDRDGVGARAQWEQWMAAEDEYVKRERPQERADLVLPGDQDLWS